MKLYFKQKLMSFMGDAEIYDESGNVMFIAKGKMGWGRIYKVYDKYGNEAGTIKQAVFKLYPRFDIYLGEDYVGSIRKDTIFAFSPRYTIDYNGWSINGSFWETNYCIKDREGNLIATVEKELMHLSDRYVLDISEDAVPDPLTVLMFVLAIDAEKASRS